MQSHASRIAAVLLPALITCGWAGWMVRPLSHGGEADHHVRSLVRSLARRDPQLVVVGNSTIHSDIDLRQLSRWQGGEASVKLEVPGTRAPTWYLLLRDRVYGAGYQPDWIVVAGPPGALLAARPHSAAAHSRLLAVATTLDPVLEARLYGVSLHEQLAGQARARQEATARAVVHGIRDLAAGLLFAPYGSGSVIERGAEISSAAYASRIRDAQPARLGAALSAQGLEPASLEGSFVPDLVALARSNGAQIVFVALPLRDPEHNHAHEAATAELGAWLASESVPFVDLRHIGLSPREFSDDIHLNEDGRKRLMVDLMAALTEPDSASPASQEVVIDLLAGEPRFAGPPPAIQHGPPRWGRAAALVPVRGGAYLPLEALLSVSARHGCTPIRILRDGVPQEVFPNRQGLMFPLPEPEARSGTWVVELRDDRRCDWWAHSGAPWQRVLTRGAEGYRHAPSAEAKAALEAGRWLYPADQARWSVTDVSGADGLELSGFALRSEGAQLELWHGGEVHASWRLEPDRLDGQLVRLALPPVPPGPAQLVIRGGDEGFLYLVQLALVRRVSEAP